MLPSNPTFARRARLRRQRRENASLPLFLALGTLMGSLCLLALLPAAVLSRALGPGLGALNLAAPQVLVMGVDRRPDEAGPSRSDSMILAGLNPDTGQAGLLSIPRDLWVSIPGVGSQRINAALVLGDDPANPAAGPQLAGRTVGDLFGQPVDRYMVLDFQTFVRLVDAMGGIEVDAPQPIVDTAYPTFDYGVTTIRFAAGPQVLDGEQALVYVRTRHDDDDFGRAERQQQVIGAMTARLAQPATWAQLPAIFAVLRDGVLTDLTPADLPGLAPLALAVLRGKVATATLDGDRTTPWTTEEGAWVLLPNWPAIDQVVDELFGR